jgi:hypothetical protein
MKKPEVSSEIIIKIFRHSKKENDKLKSDQEIRLTKEGRELARQKTPGISENSLAFGSSRDRTKETAGIMMSGNASNSFEELEEELMAEVSINPMKGQSRIGEELRLDFNDDSSTPYGKKFLEAYMEGRYLSFLFKESDAYAKEVGDVDGSTYSRLAGNVAEIVKKYTEISEKAWHPLMNDPNKKYLPSEKLNRFMGTHAGVGESFLAKLIEKTKGERALDEFTELLNNNGFDFVEGFEISIKQTGTEKHLKVSYRKKKENGEEYIFEEEIPEELLNEIIEEGKK